MAFPTIAAIEPSVQGSNVTTHPLAYCTGITAGQLLIAEFVNDGSSTVAFPDGWEQIFSTANGSAVRLSFYKKVADGSESGTFNVTTSAAQHSAAVVFRVPDAEVATVATPATGSGSEADVPNCNPGSSEDYLWVGSAGYDNRYRLTSDYAPSDFTGQATVGSHASNTTDSCFLYLATRQLAASSLNPGAFNSDREEEWVAGHFALRTYIAPPSSSPIEYINFM